MTKLLILCAIIFASVTCSFSASNLTCYQCQRSTEEECGLADLKPCASIYDRCAIHFTKSNRNGFSVKRECGLAPCGFDDEMVAKGLGMNCDRSKDEYGCTFCCKANGCNRNDSSPIVMSKILLFSAIILICLINVARDFIPPYIMTENLNLKK